MKKFDTGQSLIEIIIATAIIAVVLVGVSDLITRSVSLATFQAKKNEAVNIAQNQLNYYRQQRDLAPKEFFLNPTTNCVGTFDTSIYTCRIFYTESGDGLEMKAQITWIDGEKTIVTELTQLLGKLQK